MEYRFPSPARVTGAPAFGVVLTGHGFASELNKWLSGPDRFFKGLPTRSSTMAIATFVLSAALFALFFGLVAACDRL